VAAEHRGVNVALLAVPALSRTDRGHGGHERQLRINAGQRPELVGERRIFRPAIGMEYDDRVRQAAGADGFDEDAPKRSNADAAREEDGRSGGMVQPKIAKWALDSHHRPERHGLQDPLECRVAQASRDRDHGLPRSARDREIEKPRTLPSASVSGGSRRVMSTNWPARYDQPRGFAKWKDIVRSATGSRPTKGVSKTGQP
jgi:hypothetical protein